MSSVLIYDSVRGKKVRLTVQAEATVGRMLEILVDRYEHLAGLDLVLVYGEEVFQEDLTLARLREEFSLDETIPVLLAERGPEDESESGDPSASTYFGIDLEEIEMADLDTIDAISALEARLGVLEERAGDDPVVLAGGDPVALEVDRGVEGGGEAKKIAFSLEEDLSGSESNRVDEDDASPVVESKEESPGAVGWSREVTQERRTDRSDSREKTGSGRSSSSGGAGGARRVSVRYPGRIPIGRSGPLTIVVSRKDRRSATRTDGSGVRTRVPVPVEIVPFFPSCLVVPSKAEVDASLLRSDAKFWITPMAPEGLEEAHVEIVRGGKVLQRVPTPVVVLRRGPVGILAFVAFLAFFGTFYADRVGAWPGWEGRTGEGLGLAILFLVAAALWTWRGRMRPAAPRNGSFEVEA